MYALLSFHYFCYDDIVGRLKKKIELQGDIGVMLFLRHMCIIIRCWKGNISK